MDADSVDRHDRVRRLRFGMQLDARPVTGRVGVDGELTEEAVAGYIAKYTTKSTEDLDPNEPGARRSAHIRRLSDTVDELHTRATAAGGRESPYVLLTKWSRSLGYCGHCTSKSRSYSTTMGALRRVRREHARQSVRGGQGSGAVVEGCYDLAEAEAEPTVIVGSWQYAGMGWLTDGDAALAAMASAAARDYAKQRSQDRRQHVDLTGASSR